MQETNENIFKQFEKEQNERNTGQFDKSLKTSISIVSLLLIYI